MNTNSKTGPGVRKDHRTGQFVPTLDGKDVSPTSFDKDRAMTIAQGHWLTKSQAPKVAHTPTPWTISGITGDHHLMARCNDGQKRTVAIFVGWPGITPEELEANKAFAQCAVNSHQALIDGLEDILDAIQHPDIDDHGTTVAKVFDIASAALALAKGEAV